ncbi:MAG: baseplate J/gp47 family protein [Humidesulfovibrio sp.]
MAAGVAGNADSGILLNLVSPVSGVQPQASALAGLAGGADAETDDSLRARLLARIRKPVRGGASDDYVTWALTVPGVTRAWTSAQELGAGTVTLRFMMDGTYADGIPQAADVALVQAVLDALRPVTADLFVVAPVPLPLSPSIRLTPDLASVRAAVEAELADMLLYEAVPGGTILISHVREAISIALGETDHVLLSPTEDVVCAAGEIAVVGDIDWGD